MKVLLDENLSPRLRSVLIGHEAVTVRYAGWAGLTNGELLHSAEEAEFDVFLTGDQNLSYQQNLNDRVIAVVVLTAHSWDLIEEHLHAIRAAVDATRPGSFQVIECGKFRRWGCFLPMRFEGWRKRVGVEPTVALVGRPPVLKTGRTTGS